MRKTKIIATIGPATPDEKSMRGLIRAGVNVARLNFSHGDHDTHEKRLRLVRNAAKAENVPVAILQDLCGHKIRIGTLYKERIALRKGSIVTLTTRPCAGDETRLYVNYKKLPKVVKKGAHILLDDGTKKLVVISVSGNSVRCKVIVGGELRAHKGVNLPGISLKTPALTKKDKHDVLFGIKHDVDYIALSFVHSASDVRELRGILAAHGADIGIIAKIETQDAIEHIDEIVEESDGLLIARGDLAVELPPEHVPLLQKMIVEKCNMAGKPVIVATQMLDSMVHAHTPTRAEVSDVANSILDGADAVMLSAETAVGEHPIEAVATMATVARHTESGFPHWKVLGATGAYTRERKTVGTADAISHYVVNIAYDVGVKVIVALTESGSTPRMIARYRPERPILALTPNAKTLGKMMLVFGCYPMPIRPFRHVGEAMERIKKMAVKHGFAEKGDKIIIAAGIPFGKTGSTNMLMVHTI